MVPSMHAPEKALESEIEAVADACFTHLVQNPQDLQRFMAETGYAPDTIGKAVGTHGFNLAMIEFVMRSEPLLLAISANAGLTPERIAGLWRRLNPET
jgi:hypothetical protein